MKKKFGTFLLWLAGGLILFYVLSWALWSAYVAMRMLEPIVAIGVVIIIAIVGIHLRGDK